MNANTISTRLKNAGVEITKVVISDETIEDDCIELTEGYYVQVGDSYICFCQKCEPHHIYLSMQDDTISQVTAKIIATLGNNIDYTKMDNADLLALYNELQDGIPARSVPNALVQLCYKRKLIRGTTKPMNTVTAAPTEVKQPTQAQVDASILAQKFAKLMQKEIGIDNLRKVVAKHIADRKGYTHACATHEFCDANMVMAAAFKAVVGRKEKLQSDADISLINHAWNLAKKNDFFLETVTA